MQPLSKQCAMVRKTSSFAGLPVLAASSWVMYTPGLSSKLLQHADWCSKHLSSSQLPCAEAVTPSSPAMA